MSEGGMHLVKLRVAYAIEQKKVINSVKLHTVAVSRGSRVWDGTGVNTEKSGSRAFRRDDDEGKE